ncbi:hypothetical protein [Denitrobaculum tricleocarpae]|uniref:Uncharacterized protein n=1 Tax=Denitrobaculum tricleocarpae TaxID=2591009 RepID=A0A545TU91_9PROT|nr:hypothetical protein [Denitrobaculum tricleocarpae]TQV80786.1 hypothetical protein FKG95_11595 [Denitrobaculum tricleocarpae]
MNRTLLVPHGVVFFMDDSHPDVIVPMHDDDGIADASSSCVSIFCMIDMEGEVFVELANEIAGSKKENLQQVFEGVIEAPGRKIGMSTSDGDVLMEVDVAETEARLSVWVDHPKWPTTVLVEAN